MVNVFSRRYRIKIFSKYVSFGVVGRYKTAEYCAQHALGGAEPKAVASDRFSELQVLNAPHFASKFQERLAPKIWNLTCSF